MNDTIKRENRKSLPRFLLTLLGAGLAGGVLGFCGAMFADGSALAGLGDGVRQLLTLAAPWGIPASALLLGPAWGIYLCSARAFGALQQAELPDEEETDRQMEKIDRRLTVALLLSNLAMLMDLFFLAASFQTPWPLLNVLFFCLAMALITLLQQKVVDLTRRMNPEKKGSVYDLKFQKKWLESCDEAERAQIGQAAFQAYKATNLACGVVWLLLVFSNTLFGVGLLPVFLVLVIWGVLQVSYILASLKISRPRRETK